MMWRVEVHEPLVGPVSAAQRCTASGTRGYYPGGVPFRLSTWPARYNDPVISIRGGTS